MLQPSTPIEQLGEDIAALAMRIHAATYQLLVMLREFDSQKGWNNGFLSCAHWLSWRTGIDMGAAREKVRVARALDVLPRLSGALERGEISYAKVRALTRVATAAERGAAPPARLQCHRIAGGARRARLAPMRPAGGSARRQTASPVSLGDHMRG
ncbi:MAG TPA: DUF222 domain-containing protein [Vicinamibacterales bacterium]|jgi:hypothetical protein|nr:DUF222 domain-containing protein [Vicinamibacterales bacterium]